MSGHKVGDRVRITFEALVKKNGDFELGRGATLASYAVAAYATDVEPITLDLPTTPGTVLQADGAHCWLLGSDYRWRCQSSRRGLDSAYFLSAYADRLTVIFDAGAK